MKKKKDLSDTEDITFAMRNRQEWFNENMTQKDLARKMGRSEAAISRWMSGFPNLTLKSIAEFSTALGEPMIKVNT